MKSILKATFGGVSKSESMKQFQQQLKDARQSLADFERATANLDMAKMVRLVEGGRIEVECEEGETVAQNLIQSTEVAVLNTIMSPNTKIRHHSHKEIEWIICYKGELHISLDYSSAPGGESVLFVDDEEPIRRVAKMAFAKLRPKCNLVTATSFEEAKAIIESKKFSGYILDVNLNNNKTGFDLLATIRQKEKLAPVLMMSGYGWSGFERFLVDRPAMLFCNIGFVQKPINMRLLVETVSSSMHRFDDGVTLSEGEGIQIPPHLLHSVYTEDVEARCMVMTIPAVSWAGSPPESR